MRLKKLAAGTTAAAYFLVNGVFLHAGETNFWRERRASRPAPVLEARLPAAPDRVLQSLPSVGQSLLSPEAAQQLPSRFLLTHKNLLDALAQAPGTLRRIHMPADGRPARVVVHIQDVHMNAEAQRHIRDTVQGLIDARAAGLVALEGAFGPADLSRFRAFPDRTAVMEIADLLLDKNKISGPFHAALTSATDVPPFTGVDDRAHYDANVAAYQSASAEAPARKASLAAGRPDVERRKAAGFNGDLRRFDERVSAFHDGTVPFGDYVQAVAADGAAGQAALFLQALRMEKSLDFPRVEAERARLIETLVPRLSKAQTEALVLRSAAYRAGQLRYADFYRELQSLCRAGGVPLSGFPALDEYVRYVLLADGIDAEKLMAETAVLEKAAYARLARTAEEKELVAESLRLRLTGKLLDFALTPTEWADYAALNPAGGKDASFERFYHEAHARDGAMAENLLKAWPAGKDSAVLVTGGFHAGGMTDRLTKAGCAVISFVPRLEKADLGRGTAYLSVFTREKTPLENLFQGDRLFLSPLQLSESKPLEALAAGLTAARAGAARGARVVEELYEKLVQGVGVRARVTAGKVVLRLSRQDEAVDISVFLSPAGKVADWSEQTARFSFVMGAVGALTMAAGHWALSLPARETAAHLTALVILMAALPVLAALMAARRTWEPAEAMAGLYRIGGKDAGAPSSRSPGRQSLGSGVQQRGSQRGGLYPALEASLEAAASPRSTLIDDPVWRLRTLKALEALDKDGWPSPRMRVWLECLRQGNAASLVRASLEAVAWWEKIQYTHIGNYGKKEFGRTEPWFPKASHAWAGAGDERVIGGRYSFSPKADKLGSGGTSNVYKAFDNRTRSYVALKVSHTGGDQGKDLTEEEKAQERAIAKGMLKREYVQQRKLEGVPGVPQALDAGWFESEDGEGAFVAMEFIPGAESLESYQQRLGRSFNAMEIVQIGTAVAEIMGRIHARGYAVADLKEGNVLVVRDERGAIDRVLLVDHGSLVSVDGESASLVATMVTPESSSPEMMDSNHSAAGDRYSLGSMLFRMWNGRFPFHSRLHEAPGKKEYTEQERVERFRDLQRIKSQTPVPPFLRLGAPAGLEALVRDLMSVDPETRPKDISARLAEVEKSIPAWQRDFQSLEAELGRAARTDHKAAADPAWQGRMLKRLRAMKMAGRASPRMRTWMEGLDNPTVVLPEIRRELGELERWENLVAEDAGEVKLPQQEFPWFQKVGHYIREKDGREVVGRYVILASLGEGGMAKAYVAEDEVTGKKVVLKVQDKDLSADGIDAFSWFQVEYLRQHRLMGLPSTPEPYEAGWYDGPDGRKVCFMAMEYVPETTTLFDEMAEAMDNKQALPWEDIRRVGEMLLAAVADMRRAGFMTADMKPENVLVVRGPDGDVVGIKILDYGSIVRLPKGNSVKAAMATTPLYAAPESFPDQNVHGMLTVQYAVAGVLYEMATGKPPFTSPIDPKQANSYVFDLRSRKFAGKPDPIDRKDLPADFWPLILRMLKPKPMDRPRDALAEFRALPHENEPGKGNTVLIPAAKAGEEPLEGMPSLSASSLEDLLARVAAGDGAARPRARALLEKESAGARLSPRSQVWLEGLRDGLASADISRELAVLADGEKGRLMLSSANPGEAWFPNALYSWSPGQAHHVGPYEFSNLMPLGTGSMARVHPAKVTATGEGVALKIFRKESLDGLDGAILAKTEYLIQRRLEGVPGVRKALSAGWYKESRLDTGHFFIAMEEVPGAVSLQEELARAHKEDRPLGRRDMLFITKSLADTLKGIHAAGYVYADLKPANVLIQRGADGRVSRVLLTDFGSTVHAPDGLAVRGRDLGTAEFSAPEALAPENPRSPATDLYSLGFLLLLMATARSVAATGVPIDELRRQRETSDPFLEEERPDADIAALVRELMSPDPARRPADVDRRTARLLYENTRGRTLLLSLSTFITALASWVMTACFPAPGYPAAEIPPQALEPDPQEILAQNPRLAGEVMKVADADRSDFARAALRGVFRTGRDVTDHNLAAMAGYLGTVRKDFSERLIAGPGVAVVNIVNTDWGGIVPRLASFQSATGAQVQSFVGARGMEGALSAVRKGRGPLLVNLIGHGRRASLELEGTGATASLPVLALSDAIRDRGAVGLTSVINYSCQGADFNNALLRDAGALGAAFSYAGYNETLMESVRATELGLPTLRALALFQAPHLQSPDRPHLVGKYLIQASHPNENNDPVLVVSGSNNAWPFPGSAQDTAAPVVPYNPLQLKNGNAADYYRVLPGLPAGAVELSQAAPTRGLMPGSLGGLWKPGSAGWTWGFLAGELAVFGVGGHMAGMGWSAFAPLMHVLIPVYFLAHMALLARLYHAPPSGTPRLSAAAFWTSLSMYALIFGLYFVLPFAPRLSPLVVALHALYDIFAVSGPPAFSRPWLAPFLPVLVPAAAGGAPGEGVVHMADKRKAPRGLPKSLQGAGTTGPGRWAGFIRRYMTGPAPDPVLLLQTLLYFDHYGPLMATRAEGLGLSFGLGAAREQDLPGLLAETRRHWNEEDSGLSLEQLLGDVAMSSHVQTGLMWSRARFVAGLGEPSALSAAAHVLVRHLVTFPVSEHNAEGEPGGYGPGHIDADRTVLMLPGLLGAGAREEDLSMIARGLRPDLYDLSKTSRTSIPALQALTRQREEAGEFQYRRRLRDGMQGLTPAARAHALETLRILRSRETAEAWGPAGAPWVNDPSDSGTATAALNELRRRRLLESLDEDLAALEALEPGDGTIAAGAGGTSHQWVSNKAVHVLLLEQWGSDLWAETLEKRNGKLKKLTDRGFIRSVITRVGGEIVRVPVIPLKDLFLLTGDLAYVGLGQAYGRPVIYVDQAYEHDRRLLDHELWEIRRWDWLRRSMRLNERDLREYADLLQRDLLEGRLSEPDFEGKRKEADAIWWPGVGPQSFLWQMMRSFIRRYWNTPLMASTGRPESESGEWSMENRARLGKRTSRELMEAFHQEAPPIDDLLEDAHRRIGRMSDRWRQWLKGTATPEVEKALAGDLARVNPAYLRRVNRSWIQHNVRMIMQAQRSARPDVRAVRTAFLSLIGSHIWNRQSTWLENLPELEEFVQKKLGEKGRAPAGQAVGEWFSSAFADWVMGGSRAYDETKGWLLFPREDSSLDPTAPQIMHVFERITFVPAKPGKPALLEGDGVIAAGPQRIPRDGFLQEFSWHFLAFGLIAGGFGGFFYFQSEGMTGIFLRYAVLGTALLTGYVMARLKWMAERAAPPFTMNEGLLAHAEWVLRNKAKGGFSPHRDLERWIRALSNALNMDREQLTMRHKNFLIDLLEDDVRLARFVKAYMDIAEEEAGRTGLTWEDVRLHLRVRGRARDRLHGAGIAGPYLRAIEILLGPRTAARHAQNPHVLEPAIVLGAAVWISSWESAQALAPWALGALAVGMFFVLPHLFMSDVLARYGRRVEGGKVAFISFLLAPLAAVVPGLSWPAFATVLGAAMALQAWVERWQEPLMPGRIRAAAAAFLLVFAGRLSGASATETRTAEEPALDLPAVPRLTLSLPPLRPDIGFETLPLPDWVNGGHRPPEMNMDQGWWWGLYRRLFLTPSPWRYEDFASPDFPMEEDAAPEGARLPWPAFTIPLAGRVGVSVGVGFTGFSVKVGDLSAAPPSPLTFKSTFDRGYEVLEEKFNRVKDTWFRRGLKGDEAWSAFMKSNLMNLGLTAADFQAMEWDRFNVRDQKKIWVTIAFAPAHEDWKFQYSSTEELVADHEFKASASAQGKAKNGEPESARSERDRFTRNMTGVIQKIRTAAAQARRKGWQDQGARLAAGGLALAGVALMAWCRASYLLWPLALVPPLFPLWFSGYRYGRAVQVAEHRRLTIAYWKELAAKRQPGVPWPATVPMAPLTLSVGTPKYIPSPVTGQADRHPLFHAGELLDVPQVATLRAHLGVTGVTQILGAGAEFHSVPQMLQVLNDAVSGFADEDLAVVSIRWRQPDGTLAERVVLDAAVNLRGRNLLAKELKAAVVVSVVWNPEATPGERKVYFEEATPGLGGERLVQALLDDRASVLWTNFPGWAVGYLPATRGRAVTPTAGEGPATERVPSTPREGTEPLTERNPATGTASPSPAADGPQTDKSPELPGLVTRRGFLASLAVGGAAALTAGAARAASRPETLLRTPEDAPRLPLVLSRHLGKMALAALPAAGFAWWAWRRWRARGITAEDLERFMADLGEEDLSRFLELFDKKGPDALKEFVPSPPPASLSFNDVTPPSINVFSHEEPGTGPNRRVAPAVAFIDKKEEAKASPAPAEAGRLFVEDDDVPPPVAVRSSSLKDRINTHWTSVLAVLPSVLFWDRGGEALLPFMSLLLFGWAGAVWVWRAARLLTVRPSPGRARIAAVAATAHASDDPAGTVKRLLSGLAVNLDMNDMTAVARHTVEASAGSSIYMEGALAQAAAEGAQRVVPFVDAEASVGDWKGFQKALAGFAQEGRTFRVVTPDPRVAARLAGVAGGAVVLVDPALFTSLGNGLQRVNLSRLKDFGLFEGNYRLFRSSVVELGVDLDEPDGALRAAAAQAWILTVLLKALPPAAVDWDKLGRVLAAVLAAA